MNRGLEQVKAALIDALEEAGLTARAAFEPGWAETYSQPVIAVGFRRGESHSDAFHCYLGQQTDPSTQACREVYGMRMDLTLSVDIYSPAQVGAAGCEEALERLHHTLMEALPAGLRPQSLQWEETAWDETVGMFLRKGSLSCQAHFTAEASEDGALLSDFILKGRVTK